MGRRLDYEKMYNKHLKKRFLTDPDNQFEKSTIINYGAIFIKTAPFETQIKKELCDFNRDDIDKLLYVFSSKTINSLRERIAVLSSYVTWCIKEGEKEDKVNWFMTFMDDKILTKYISGFAKEQQYFKNEEELRDFANFSDNAQDVATIYLIKEGAWGLHFDEIINLKVSDIYPDDNYIVLTRNTGEKRKLTVAPDTIRYLQAADNQRLYNRMGTTRTPMIPLNINEYVIRSPLYISTVITAPVRYHIIRGRIARIAKAYGNPYISPSSIRYSGMIFYTREYMKQRGIRNVTDLTYDNWLDINERFGIRRITQYVITTKRRIQDYI